MMSFEAKLEHRRPKYRSLKIANFGNLTWNAMGRRGFQKQKGNIEIIRTEHRGAVRHKVSYFDVYIFIPGYTFL